MKITVYDQLGTRKGEVDGEITRSAAKNGGPLHEATIRLSNGDEVKHLVREEDVPAFAT